MLTFTLIILGLFVIGLLIGVYSLAKKGSEMESDLLLTPKYPSYREEIARLEKMLVDSINLNTEVFDVIAKELGKQLKKTRIVTSDGWREKIVTKFELVDLPKVKKTK
jgi:hypothetical protein